ncbi:hypothetical protein AMATHDRAFT_141654 [Amanita thiersii Skay4041]|uniref:F-box domain-containing protein n=1 Tax=Amanita thiersii Skay4041 TaxID=703135 RepID=A0A2A9NR54_9AGAR|nr:hypothetical protein AMATHDRAFT_141654 [Amanita thiersii Skay4041]
MVNTEPDTSELAKFREEWRAEVQQRRTAANLATSHPQPPPSPTKPYELKQRTSTTIAAAPSAHETPVPKIYVNATAPSQTHVSALEIYRQAIQHEQQGLLDNALALYRQAFRMDAHVDRAYSRDEKLAAVFSSQQHILPKTSPDADKTIIDRLSQDLSHAVTISTNKAGITIGALAQLVSTFSHQLTFEPEDEKQPLWLRSLPDEMIVAILRMLDITSIERFAAVCRKARVVSLDATLWRHLVFSTYKPPQISESEDISLIVDRYLCDYRRMYIEYPRVRLDGVYIAICHYVRPGLSDNQWANISHLITYHRFLRFYPNGMVLSFLVNGEMNPQQVIPLLKPTLRAKGFSLGTWRLLGDTIHLNLVEANGKITPSLPPPFEVLNAFLEETEIAEVGGASQRHASHVPHRHSGQSTEQQTRYTFVMTLALRSRPVGRWNRLDIETYDSISLATGGVTPVALKHERPFWFSKVRSYSP